jgi:hypothetical protein
MCGWSACRWIIRCGRSARFADAALSAPSGRFEPLYLSQCRSICSIRSERTEKKAHMEAGVAHEFLPAPLALPQVRRLLSRFAFSGRRHAD